MAFRAIWKVGSSWRRHQQLCNHFKISNLLIVSNLCMSIRSIYRKVSHNTHSCDSDCVHKVQGICLIHAGIYVNIHRCYILKNYQSTQQKTKFNHNFLYAVIWSFFFIYFYICCLHNLLGFSFLICLPAGRGKKLKAIWVCTTTSSRGTNYVSQRQRQCRN